LRGQRRPGPSGSSPCERSAHTCWSPPRMGCSRGGWTLAQQTPEGHEEATGSEKAERTEVQRVEATFKATWGSVMEMEGGSDMEMEGVSDMGSQQGSYREADGDDDKQQYESTEHCINGKQAAPMHKVQASQQSMPRRQGVQDELILTLPPSPPRIFFHHLVKSLYSSFTSLSFFFSSSSCTATTTSIRIYSGASSTFLQLHGPG
jgi:hypothetical protein